MNRLLIIGGPTASGKSRTAIEVAKRQDGEIISADSAAVYKGMDIGTAKPAMSERDGIRHHLIDVCDISHDYNVAVFTSMAKESIEDITARGRLPIIAGGTGFYIRALLYDADFDVDKGADELRAMLTEEAKTNGAEAMYERLLKVDPEYAKTVHANNVKRVIRALEFYEQTGIRFSEYNEEQRKKKGAYDFRYFVLTMPRDILYRRIEERVDRMIEDGLYDEVKRLKEEGAERGMVSMQALGYKQMLKCLDGECTFDEAVYEIKRDTRHFAKRQMTWWKREKDVIMLDATEYDNDPVRISEAIEAML